MATKSQLNTISPMNDVPLVDPSEVAGTNINQVGRLSEIADRMAEYKAMLVLVLDDIKDAGEAYTAALVDTAEGVVVGLHAKEQIDNAKSKLGAAVLAGLQANLITEARAKTLVADHTGYAVSATTGNVSKTQPNEVGKGIANAAILSSKVLRFTREGVVPDKAPEHHYTDASKGALEVISADIYAGEGTVYTWEKAIKGVFKDNAPESILALKAGKISDLAEQIEEYIDDIKGDLELLAAYAKLQAAIALLD